MAFLIKKRKVLFCWIEETAFDSQKNLEIVVHDFLFVMQDWSIQRWVLYWFQCHQGCDELHDEEQNPWEKFGFFES